LDPIRERRARFARRPGLVKEIVAAGNQRMREESEATMALVREAMGLPSLESLPISGGGTPPPGLVYC
jgi:tryptophanyl-tRNA synthetase